MQRYLENISSIQLGNAFLFPKSGVYLWNAFSAFETWQEATKKLSGYKFAVLENVTKSQG